MDSKSPKLLIALSLLFFLGCPAPNEKPKADQSSTTVPGVLQKTPDSGTPLEPIWTNPAPPLNQALITVMEYDLNAQRAVAIGQPTAAPAGVDEVCVLSPNGTRTCGPAQSDGSFQIILTNVQPNEKVQLWGEGPSYSNGGPGINSITEIVQYWLPRFPQAPRAMIGSSDALYVGGDDGLFVFSRNQLPLAPDNVLPLHYSIAQGLPSNEITALAEDGDGGVWVGTGRGLIRFKDGKFSDFQAALGFYPTPGGTRVESLASEVHSDGSRTLWVAAGGAISGTNRFGYSGNYPQTYCLAPDGSGSGVWVGTMWGLFHFQASNGTYPDATYFSGTPVRALQQDAQGSLWVGTDGGLFQRTGDSFVTRSTGDVFRSLWFDRDGTLWAATDNGVVHVSSDNSIRRWSAPLALPSAPVSSITRDGLGNLWVGMPAWGIGRFDGTTWTPYRSAQSLAGFSVQAVAPNDLNSFWAATNNGLSLVELSGEVAKFQNYTTSEGLRSNYVKSLAVVRPGEVWAGTIGGGLSHVVDSVVSSYTAEQGLPGRNVSALALGDHGDVWIGLSSSPLTTTGRGLAHLDNGAFVSFTSINGVWNQDISSLAFEAGRGIWIGTAIGLALYSNGIFSTIGQNESIWSNVGDISNSAGGGIWLAVDPGFDTPDFGVTFLKDGTAQHYGTAHGLLSRSVNSIADDLNGGFWSGSNGGLTHVRNGCGTTYTGLNGLPSNDILDIAMLPSGVVLFGTDNGVGILIDASTPKCSLTSPTTSIPTQQIGGSSPSTPTGAGGKLTLTSE